LAAAADKPEKLATGHDGDPWFPEKDGWQPPRIYQNSRQKQLFHFETMEML